MTTSRLYIKTSPDHLSEDNVSELLPEFSALSIVAITNSGYFHEDSEKQEKTYSQATGMFFPSHGNVSPKPGNTFQMAMKQRTTGSGTTDRLYNVPDSSLKDRTEFIRAGRHPAGVLHHILLLLQRNVFSDILCKFVSISKISTRMRKIVVVILFLVVVLPLKGQTLADDASSWAGEWKAAFSVDGRRKWKPEFTVRYSAGFISEGPLITLYRTTRRKGSALP